MENFELNVLEDNISDSEKLKEREIYWIKYYNTYEDRQHYNETPGGDLPGYNTVHLGEEHGMSKLTEEEVKFCREKYREGCRSRNIYNQYFKDRIGWSGFLRMWHGYTWKHVMPEVFEVNPHRAKYTAKDRDILIERYNKSDKSFTEFAKSDECYVGYATFWNMVHHPEFYDNK